MVDNEYKQSLVELKKALKGNLNRIAKKAKVSLTYVGMVLSGDAVNGDKVEEILTIAKEMREEVTKEKAARMEKLKKIIA